MSVIHRQRLQWYYNTTSSPIPRMPWSKAYSSSRCQCPSRDIDDRNRRSAPCTLGSTLHPVVCSSRLVHSTERSRMRRRPVPGLGHVPSTPDLGSSPWIMKREWCPIDCSKCTSSKVAAVFFFSFFISFCSFEVSIIIGSRTVQVGITREEIKEG